MIQNIPRSVIIFLAKGVDANMIHKELKNLTRRELVDIIYQLKKNEQQLQDEIASLREELQDKRIRLSEAGSIADAAVSITDILTSAQKTADLYLYEISCMKAETEKECAQMIEAAKQTVESIYMNNANHLDEISHSEERDYQPLMEEVQAWEKIIVRELLEGAEYV